MAGGQDMSQSYSKSRYGTLKGNKYDVIHLITCYLKHDN